jgi:acyl-CoA synthetase (AMP-forming)/AMP-acid ligase II
MSLSCLSDLLARVEPNHPLWISPNDEVITAAVLAEWVSVDIAPLRDCDVAISLDSASDLARCLVTLDGVCRSILLLPPGLNNDEAESLRSQVGTGQTIGGEQVRKWTSSQQRPTRDVTTRWILATSGTTGKPKLVQHTLSSLTRTVSFDLTIGREHVWSSLYNLTGFAGLQVFLQAWCGGSSLLLHNDDASLFTKIDRMSRFGVTALSATPTMWRKILMTGDVSKLQLRRITLGGEVSDQKVLDALTNSFPTAKITQIYASTEAGVGFSVRDRIAGFPVEYLQQPPAGVEIRVDDNRLLLRSPASTQRFVSDDMRLHRDDGFIDTGDRVRRSGDRFEFLGRANGSINVGGNKVHPEEVECILRDCVGVIQARVYAKTSPFTGSLVAADIVGESSAEPSVLRKRLLAWCRQHLDAHKVPAIIRVVESIETNAAGKLKRSA